MTDVKRLKYFTKLAKTFYESRNTADESSTFRNQTKKTCLQTATKEKKSASSFIRTTYSRYSVQVLSQKIG